MSQKWRVARVPICRQISNYEFFAEAKDGNFGVARKRVAEVLVRGYVFGWLLKELTRISAN